MNPSLKISKENLICYCTKNHIKRLSVFGSAIRDDFHPESDVDLLVIFEQGAEPGFLGLAKMERELTEIFGRKVDLRTPQDLSSRFRDDVIRNAELQYAG